MTSKKLFKDLTEEEIIAEAVKAIPDFLEDIRDTGYFDLEECLRMQLRRIERLYRSKHGIFSHGMMDSRERRELDEVLAHYRVLLYERTVAIRQKYLKSRRISQINSVTAQALIGETFREAGFKAVVSGQRYRARVEVSAPPHSVRFYLNYKKMMQEGALDEAVQSVKDVIDALDRLGYGARVK